MHKNEKIIKAKIISKNTFINSKERSLHSIYVFQTNLLTFQLENNQRIVLEVPPTIFSCYLEGDAGLLTYEVKGQSNSFVSFKLNYLNS